MPTARSPHFAIRRKVTAGFLAAFALMVLIAVFSYRGTDRYLETVRGVAHARQRLEHKEGFLRSLYEAESAAKGFAASGNDAFIPLFDLAQKSVVLSHNRLKQLSSEDPELRRRVAEVKPLVVRKLAFLKDGIAIRLADGPEALAVHFARDDDMEVMGEIRGIMQRFADRVAEDISIRTRDAEEASHVAGIVAATGPIAGFLLLVGALAVILRDITARRNAEEELAAQRTLLHNVIDAIPDLISVKDRAGRYVINNRAHREVLRIQGISEIEGRTVEDFHAPHLAKQFRDEDRYVLSTGIPILNRERAQLDAEGRIEWFSTNKVPLRSPGGEIIGLVSITSDITERRVAEEQIRHTAARLERSNRELQDFASVASHDLQEPLRKILAFSDRLKSKCGPALGPDGAHYLDRVMHAARRMQTLIQDLLTLARVTSRAQPFAKTDLGKIVREVIDDLEVRIEQARATVETGDLPVLEADPLQMRQLFQNLLSNALKFQCPDRKPSVKVFAQRVPPPLMADAGETRDPSAEDHWQITVEDNGIGFDPKFSDRIFQVFQRLHARDAFDGTGIGLAVVRKIVDRHSGTIEAIGKEGEGAKFIVTLPAKQAKENYSDEAR